MSSKAYKRKEAVEIEAEEQDSEPSAISAAFAKAGLVARSLLRTVAAHRWKAVLLAVALVGTGIVDLSKISSGLTQCATQRTAAPAGSPLASEQATMPAVEAAQPVAAVPSAPSIRPCFTPGENCTGLVVAAIDSARSEVLVQAYSLSSRSVIDALGRAHARRVKVRVILDKSGERERNSSGAKLISRRILPQVDQGVATAHNKVMVIDQDTVITSSFNFNTPSQKNNAENLLVIKGHPDVVSAYRKNWEKRLAQSRPYYGTMAPVL
jgi:phosphatidylserine/phosphatidylglycerophosphate/cardiolipin synthase-like enzyme